MPDPSNNSDQNDAPIRNASDYRALSRAELESALSVCERRLHEISRRFEIGLRGSSICVFLQNLNFEYEWIHNPPTGFETDDLIGKRDEDFLEADECVRFDALKHAALQANEPHKGEVTLSNGNRQRHFEVLIEPYHDIDDDLIGLLGVAVETTEQRRRTDELHRALREMSHRSRNQLTLLLSMLRQTARHFGDIEDFSLAFEERLRGSVHTQDLLVANDWRGVGLADMVKAQAHSLRLPVPEKISHEGPNVLVKPEPAQNLSLALHELMRNAARHGSLSSPNGRVKITRAFSDSTATASIMLLWIESGGPPIHLGDTTGFGLTKLRRVLRPSIGGPVEIDFRPSGLKVGLSIAETCLCDC